MKYDDGILAALAAAGVPLTAMELTKAVLGELPHPKYSALQAALQSAARRGIIERTGSAPRGPDGFKYRLPE